MILKGSQIIDLAPDGSGRAGQLASVVGVQGKLKFRRSYISFICITTWSILNVSTHT